MLTQCKYTENIRQKERAKLNFLSFAERPSILDAVKYKYTGEKTF